MVGMVLCGRSHRAAGQGNCPVALLLPIGLAFEIAPVTAGAKARIHLLPQGDLLSIVWIGLACRGGCLRLDARHHGKAWDRPPRTMSRMYSQRFPEQDDVFSIALWLSVMAASPITPVYWPSACVPTSAAPSGDEHQDNTPITTFFMTAPLLWL